MAASTAAVCMMSTRLPSQKPGHFHDHDSDDEYTANTFVFLLAKRMRSRLRSDLLFVGRHFQCHGLSPLSQNDDRQDTQDTCCGLLLSVSGDRHAGGLRVQKKDSVRLSARLYPQQVPFQCGLLFVVLSENYSWGARQVAPNGVGGVGPDKNPHQDHWPPETLAENLSGIWKYMDVDCVNKKYMVWSIVTPSLALLTTSRCCVESVQRRSENTCQRWRM